MNRIVWTEPAPNPTSDWRQNLFIPTNSICFICPTYGHYNYARSAIDSFLKYTPTGVVVVVDDAHPDFHTFWDNDKAVTAHAFRERGGLTRSWNYGLRRARELGARYAICGNDDVLFTLGWYAGPTALLENDAIGLVGPLTNGPGLTNRRQNIWDHVENYTPSDDQDDLDAVARHLSARYTTKDCLPVHAVNGFTMIGRTERWWEGRFDAANVFNPHPQFAMTQNEDELQRRFRQMGWRNVVSLASYVFHYRAVSRGEKHKAGMWFRKRAQ